MKVRGYMEVSLYYNSPPGKTFGFLSVIASELIIRVVNDNGDCVFESLCGEYILML